jgi:hypothetical protein
MWCFSFRDMLQDQQGLQYFQRFLEKDIATENLDFYLAVTKLQETASREAAFNEAQTIGKNFIELNSPKEVNIDSQMRKALLDALGTSTVETFNANIFDDVFEHVYLLMKKDSYPRFVACEEIKELLQGMLNYLTIVPLNITSICIYNLYHQTKQAFIRICFYYLSTRYHGKVNKKHSYDASYWLILLDNIRP